MRIQKSCLDCAGVALVEDPADRVKQNSLLPFLYPGLPSYSPVTALVSGEVDVVREWLNTKVANDPLGSKNWRPLEYICFSHVHKVKPERYQGVLECARLLLDARADPNTSHLAEDGESPLSVLYGASGEAGHPGLIRLLLERGAHPNDGESVDHAAQQNRRDILDLLLEFGADISSISPKWNNTPLYFWPATGGATRTQPSRWRDRNGCSSTERIPTSSAATQRKLRFTRRVERQTRLWCGYCCATMRIPT